MEKTNLWTVIIVAVVVSVLASLMTVTLTGNATRAYNVAVGDGDNGVNLTNPSDCSYQIGKVILTQRDECVSGNPKQIIEQVYNNSMCIAKTLSCPANMVCSSGACVASTAVDSDGNSTTTTGICVNTGADSSSGSYRDSCVSSTTVREYYVSDGVCTSAVISCPSQNICTDGYCSPVEVTLASLRVSSLAGSPGNKTVCANANGTLVKC